MKTVATRFNLIVIRSLEPLRTVEFYRAFGTEFEQEQHGNGPVHWSADLGGIVFEIYPAKTAEHVDRSTRLGFEVADVTSLLDGLRSLSVEITSEAKESSWGLRAVVRDPDGRSVELVQHG